MADHCAVITGVSKGLGEALAAALLARDYDVTGIGRSAAPRLASPRFRLEVADLADVATLAVVAGKLFAALAVRAPGSIVVINNAALAGPAGTIGRLEADQVVGSILVNLAAPLIIADAFVRAFGDATSRRRLINVSSGAAVRPIPGAGVYNVTKAGLEMLTSVIGAEQAAGVVAITIRPGIIDTPMQASVRSQPRDLLPSLPMFEAFHSSGQLVPPDVVAAKIVNRLVLSDVEHGRTYSYAEL